jgi:ribulose 1,5-bisphosphate synthetase/thiazole synthase
VRHLGNNAISLGSRAPIIHVGGGVNGGGVGDNALSVTSGASIVLVGVDISGDDASEGMHLRNLDGEQVLESKDSENITVLYQRSPSIP